MAIHPYTRLFVLPSAPTVDEDETEGYEIGDVVFSGGSFYDCSDATTGAAVWEERSGGGGTPGGSDNQLQFNDGGAFGGAAIDYFHSSGEAALAAESSEGAGDNLALYGAEGVDDGSGGAIKLFGGAAAGTGSGGPAQLFGGNAPDDGQGGLVTIRGGTSANGAGGNVDLRPGQGGSQDGIIRLWRPDGIDALTIGLDALTTSRAAAFPDKDGTVAYTDDIVPGGSDTQLQFNDGGSFEGAKILYSETVDTATLSTELNSDDGMSLELHPADATADGAGGNIALLGGEAPGDGDGGSVDFTGGDANGTGSGGSADIKAGSSIGGTGGHVTLEAGEGVTPGRIRLRNPISASSVDINIDDISVGREMIIPDKDGTIAYLDDVESSHIIQDEGTPLTARANLNFVGGGVTATDDAGSDATVVTIPANLTMEEVEDIIGAMVSSNTETGIAVTYDDTGGKLNFDAQTAGDARYAPIAKGVTNGDSHDHSGGDGAQIDHGGLAGLSDDDHTQYVRHNLSTASNDFLVGSGSNTWIKKTLAETITILRTSLDSIFAAIANGVTNGDSHDHNGGDGAQINHTTLSNIGTNTHAQIDTHIASTSNPHSTTAAQAVAIPQDGWIAGTGTWSYTSADAPSFVASVPDADAALMQVGYRIKLTQTTAKYFIVTAKGSPSGGFTPVTFYGGTDYTLANAAITSPYFSPVKGPFGFPLDPSKWTVTATDTSDRTQATPTQNTWYNIGSISISIPIGCWSVSYKALARAADNPNTLINQYSTLSTANNSESDTDFTTLVTLGGASGALVILATQHCLPKMLTLAAKTSYYLNAKTSLANLDSIAHRGDAGTTVIRAVCAYL